MSLALVSSLVPVTAAWLVPFLLCCVGAQLNMQHCLLCLPGNCQGRSSFHHGLSWLQLSQGAEDLDRKMVSCNLAKTKEDSGDVPTDTLPHRASRPNQLLGLTQKLMGQVSLAIRENFSTTCAPLRCHEGQPLLQQPPLSAGKCLCEGDESRQLQRS